MSTSFLDLPAFSRMTSASAIVRKGEVGGQPIILLDQGLEGG
jgi:hypothetical protein